MVAPRGGFWRCSPRTTTCVRSECSPALGTASSTKSGSPRCQYVYISMACVDDAVAEPHARALSALAEALATPSRRRTSDARRLRAASRPVAAAAVAPRREGPVAWARPSSHLRDAAEPWGHVIEAPHVGRAALPSTLIPHI